jgi:tyrosinase
VRKRGADPLPVPLDDVAWALQRPVYDAPPYDATADVNQSFRNALEGWWRVRPDGSRASDVPAGHCGPDGWMVPGRDGGELHNQVHTWTAGIVASPVGPTTMGTMLLSNSPSDPVFFLHHANVDRLWAKWQALHRDAGFEPAAHGSMAMEPFSSAGLPFSPHDVLETTDLGYTYADRVDSDDVPVPPAR